MRIPTALQEVNGEIAQQWIAQQNQRTESILYQHPLFNQFERNVLLTFTPERVFNLSFDGHSHFSCFRRTTAHPRGALQRTERSAYLNRKPKWETLLDMDALCLQEKKEWIYKDVIESEFSHSVCLVSLSLGGTDICVLREYSLATRKFIKNGFYIEAALTDAIWLSKNTLLITTNFGCEFLTASNHSAIVRVLKRGQPLSEASTVFAINRSHMGIVLDRIGPYIILTEQIDFNNEHIYLMQQENENIGFNLLPIPTDAKLMGIMNDTLALIKLSSDWMISDNYQFAKNSLISIDIEKFQNDPQQTAKNLKPTICFSPDANTTIEAISLTNRHILIETLHNINNELVILKRHKKRFFRQCVAPQFSPMGRIEVVSLSSKGKTAIVHYQNYLTPREQYLYHIKTNALTRINQSPALFDSRHFHVTLHEAISCDGIKIPYYMVASKKLRHDGCNPTLLCGYGGFGETTKPEYLNALGVNLLEKGFVYIEACIRGGGEFGPDWHQGAIGVNRQHGFDDFIAVAEDVIARKITSPKFLGIHGASNGGLLVAACAIQKPTLFGAVVCEVPLTDMLHYQQFSVGHIWTAEYGDPENPVVRDIIAKYSPLHNIKDDIRYPPFFIQTSTADDRVHPYHARALAYELQRLGNEVLFYEDPYGGHTSHIDIHHNARDNARVHLFLFEKLLTPAFAARRALTSQTLYHRFFNSLFNRKRSRNDADLESNQSPVKRRGVEYG